jgi:serine/threonine protein kinase
MHLCYANLRYALLYINTWQRTLLLSSFFSLFSLRFSSIQEDWENLGLFLLLSPWQAPLTLHMFFDILNSSKTDFIPSYPWYVPQCDLPWTTITSGCVSAIKYLHDHDIRYRDIKPDNILLDYRGGRDVFPIIERRRLSKMSCRKNMNWLIVTRVLNYRYMYPKRK